MTSEGGRQMMIDYPFLPQPPVSPISLKSKFSLTLFLYQSVSWVFRNRHHAALAIISSRFGLIVSLVLSIIWLLGCYRVSLTLTSINCNQPPINQFKICLLIRWSHLFFILSNIILIILRVSIILLGILFVQSAIHSSLSDNVPGKNVQVCGTSKPVRKTLSTSAKLQSCRKEIFRDKYIKGFRSASWLLLVYKALHGDGPARAGWCVWDRQMHWKFSQQTKGKRTTQNVNQTKKKKHSKKAVC